ncbi:MAG: YdeI/OmpD-associated family protein [Flavobacteriaceae bacterium]|nr:YdeI/OmpD-associated family protein [Flavobacteriaceae bacterium]MDH3796686.1 YdeI/OmpD-associated family protein [Flavobacteriaceae bacterium]
MHSVQIPEEIAFIFIKQGYRRVKVKASFEGKSIEYYAALQKVKGNFILMLNKPNQKKLGIFSNDYFQIQLFEDTSKYGVDMPEELEAVLDSDPDAYEVFESLTLGKKRGLIYAVAAYKTSQTRIDKSLLMADNLKREIRNPKELFKPLR